MQTHAVRAPLDIRRDDPRPRYRGAVSLERGPGWPAPWRLPREEEALYLPEGSDRLHPAAAGHPVLASRFTTALHRARCVPLLMTAAR
ncbi:hypothetical protein ACFWMG_19170 [Streptomyces sp. NPDC127074]|uniref:hypothetical protein n=1 Tax=Streptomyces sp. NPDC127074 TaxID=3347130 RepID=UPI00365A03FC